MFVHFFGPDGSGKSTQTNILANFLLTQDIKVQKCWIRSPHTLAFFLWRVFVKIGFWRAAVNPLGDVVKLPAVNRNGPLRVFWSTVELLSVLPKIWQIYYLIWKGKTIVAERYVLDTVTTIAYFLDDIDFLRSGFARILFSFLPRNTVFIFLDSDYGTIYERRAPNAKLLFDRYEKSDFHSTGSLESREFIRFQRAAYKNLAKVFDAVTIDTSTSSVEDTSSLIRKSLGF